MSPSRALIGTAPCIVIEGPDARRFAQSQFAGDVDALAPGRWQWNAWLTPQGKVRALMHLVDVGDGTLLAVLRGGEAEAIRDGLARFLLRMRATLSVRTLTCRAGEATPDGSASTIADGAVVLGFGTRCLRLGAAGAAQDPTSPATASPDPAAATAWRLEDIRRGWPRLPQGEPRFLPPALGLERLEAVDFGKGCYPGQEIAARLHYRGGHKYRLGHLRVATPLAPGPVAAEGGREVWILDAVPAEGGAEALAVVPVGYVTNINRLHDIHEVISTFDA